MPVRHGREGFVATSQLERHWTSNALDGSRTIADWYNLLRGSLEWQSGDEDANARLEAAFQATRYDTVSIKDDRTLTLGAQASAASPGSNSRAR